MRIGVVGYSAQPFDPEIAQQLLIQAVQSIDEVERIPSIDLWVVSGLTYLGIPAIAYDAAKQWDAKTMGIACEKAKDYRCHPCDRIHLIGQDWGDESEAFLASIDILIRIGGGPQSIAEVARAKELGIPVIEKELATT
jgi:hypothetical protein